MQMHPNYRGLKMGRSLMMTRRIGLFRTRVQHGPTYPTVSLRFIGCSVLRTISLSRTTSDGAFLVLMTTGYRHRPSPRAVQALWSISRMVWDGSQFTMSKGKLSTTMCRMGIGSWLVRQFTSKAKYGLRERKMLHSTRSSMFELHARTVRVISSLPHGRTIQIQMGRSSSRLPFQTWISPKG